MVAQCDFRLFHMPNESAVYSALATFSEHYQPVHTYLGVVICVLGIVCNLINIAVLTRRAMRTAVNAILCAVACCDILVMLSNLVFTTHFNLVARVVCSPHHWNYAWAVFLMLHSQLSVVGHTSSIWLSVAMAFLRYITLRPKGGRVSVRQPRKEIQQAYIAIGIVITVITVLNVPNCVNYEVRQLPMAALCWPRYQESNLTGYIVTQSQRALENNCLSFRLAFWTTGIIFKMVPCILLTTFIAILVRILGEVKRRRQRLTKGPLAANGAPDSKASVVSSTALKTTTNASQDTDRTTRMLITVICVFLITEIPQGMMTVLVGLIGAEFRQHVYANLGDVLDFLSLVNSCCTFVIYCSMSRQYRAHFVLMLGPIIRLFGLCCRGLVKNPGEASRSTQFTDCKSTFRPQEHRQSTVCSNTLLPQSEDRSPMDIISLEASPAKGKGACEESQSLCVAKQDKLTAV